jgi:hypothetical protein
MPDPLIAASRDPETRMPELLIAPTDTAPLRHSRNDPHTSALVRAAQASAFPAFGGTDA